MVVDVSYVGSRTRGLGVQKNINAISAEELALGNAMLVPVPNPFQGLLPGTSLNGATVPRQQMERTFPQFGDLTEARRSLGTTDYDSLQVSLNKRMARGLQFLVSYTYSRQLEELTYLNAQDDWNNLTRVVTATDAPHRLLFSTTYQLPFYANQQGVMGSLLGGWQMNAIVVAQSGLPVGTTAGAELVGDPALEDPTLARWFNTCTETLAGGRQNCASADEPAAWRIQAPFTLRNLTTRLEDVQDGPANADRLFALQDLRAAGADEAAGPHRVVQSVQHAVVRRPEHGRDQRRLRRGDADAGERPAEHPAGRALHVLIGAGRAEVRPSCDGRGRGRPQEGAASAAPCTQHDRRN